MFADSLNITIKENGNLLSIQPNSFVLQSNFELKGRVRLVEDYLVALL